MIRAIGIPKSQISPDGKTRGGFISQPVGSDL